ncbi:hypothetical protein ACWGI8_10000 [Streptomyces sp. NPDC054841]
MTGDELAAHPGLAAGPVYLDYNATTPVDPRVAAAMLPYLTDFFGNPPAATPTARHPAARSPKPGPGSRP